MLLDSGNDSMYTVRHCGHIAVGTLLRVLMKLVTIDHIAPLMCSYVGKRDTFSSV